jgi:hypothetical protein
MKVELNYETLVELKIEMENTYVYITYQTK